MGFHHSKQMSYAKVNDKNHRKSPFKHKKKQCHKFHSQKPLKESFRHNDSKISEETANCSSRSNSSKVSYHMLDGRRYLKEEECVYFFPVDVKESDRAILCHFLLKALWQGNFKAPIEEKLRNGEMKVLDIGCGPGPWALEMASTYPNSHFTGIDIAPDCPNEIKPKNTKFSQINILEGLPYVNNHFDYVHQRMMSTSFTSKQYDEIVLPELIRVTKSGGVIELMEFDQTCIKIGPIFAQMDEFYKDFLKKVGIDVYQGSRLRKLLENCDELRDIKMGSIEIPFGSSHGKMAKLMAENFYEGFLAARGQISAVMNISHGEYDQLIEPVFKTELNQNQTAIFAHRYSS
ncbi:hypothetical protein G9A89_023006 [Geosiphon pyriformis]|nr:hypothetical protein G9A89_023006 [Geosiphon pyriformis]